MGESNPEEATINSSILQANKSKRTPIEQFLTSCKLHEIGSYPFNHLTFGQCHGPSS